MKVSRISPGYLWSLALAGASLVLLAIPDLLRLSSHELARLNPIRNIQGSLYPDPSTEREIVSMEPDLLSQLEEGDLAWRPREEILGDGTTRFIYKTRTGEPDLTVAELRQAIESPRTFQQERQQISELLQTLRKAGVRIVLTPPIKEGAAAEWDHRLTTLRIQPEILRKGSIDFLQILTHEAIHVAQSCKGGSLQARPTSLGIHPTAAQNDLAKKLNDPIYANSTHWERGLEAEAYAMQKDSSKARQLINTECKLAMNMTN